MSVEKELVYKLYVIFSRAVSDKSFEWKPTEATDNAVDKFFKMWEKKGVKKESLGVGHLYDYFCLAYDFWTDNGEDPKLVPLLWIIGRPQMKRFENKSEDHYKWFYQNGLLKKTSIPPLSEVKKEVNGKQDRGENISEEYERQRFHNTPEGFLNCIINTTMIDNTSKWCQACKYREECLEELKIRDKTTALKRGFLKL